VSDPLLDSAQLDSALREHAGAPHWYVGFSGGLDSTVLLHLLQRWCSNHPGAPSLAAVHVNHGLHSSADDWAVHCEWLCRMLQVPFQRFDIEVEPGGHGLEAAARSGRYQVFGEVVGEGEVLFLAHHLDDQVETFFLRLLRGAGVQGLAGMPEQRGLGQGRLVRPLLATPRSQLEAYAHQHGLDAVEDPSNQDTDLDRNFLRAELLPLLESRWPGYRRTVARASEHMAGTARTLRQALPVPQTVRSALGDPGIAVEELLSVPAEAAAIKLRGWLSAAGLLAPDQATLDEFLRQLREAGAEARPRLTCSAFTLQRFGEAAYLLPPASQAAYDQPMELLPGERYDIPGVGQVGLERCKADGLALETGERLGLDWRSGGERCQPLGRSRSTSLKKLLQEAQVPPWWRDRVPLLWLDGELLAVGDLWLCRSARYRERAARGEVLWRLTWQRNLGAPGD
jgi:tRNA(Ile)-lysidine synthase